MGFTQTVRPQEVQSVTGSVVGGAPNAAAALSDQNDNTYVRTQSQFFDIAWNLRTFISSPGAEYFLRRSRPIIRRSRTSTTSGSLFCDDAEMDIRYPSGFGMQTVKICDYENILSTSATSPQTATGAWEVPWGLVSTDQDLEVRFHLEDGVITSGQGEYRIYELAVELDWRLRPQFTPRVLDSQDNDVSGGTIEQDDRKAFLDFGPVNFDGVAFMQWRAAIYEKAATLVPNFVPWQTSQPLWQDSSNQALPSGPIETPQLYWGDYVAYFQVFSHVPGELEVPSDIMSVEFKVDPTHPAPTVSLHDPGTITEGGPTVTFSWDYDHELGDRQEAYRVRIWNVAQDALYYDSGWRISEATSHQVDLDAEDVPQHTDDLLAHVQVRAIDVPHVASDTAQFEVRWGVPHCDILKPSNGEVVKQDRDVEVEWAFSDDDAGNFQAWWRVRMLLGSNVEYDTGWVAGDDTSHVIPTVLRNGFNYRIEVQLKNNHGIRSD